jgi:hypothetical protein
MELCKICKNPYHKSFGRNQIWFDCLTCKKTKEEIDLIESSEIKQYKSGEQLDFFDFINRSSQESDDEQLSKLSLVQD